MRKSRGFTLVELIIVVIIIGILATIAIPQYMKAVERARVGKAKANLGMVMQGAKMYTADHDGTAPTTLSAINDYVEMTGIDVTGGDFTYTYAGNTGAATASRKAGTTYGGQTIILNNDGTWGGNHQLK